MQILLGLPAAIAAAQLSAIDATVGIGPQLEETEVDEDEVEEITELELLDELDSVEEDEEMAELELLDELDIVEEGEEMAELELLDELESFDEVFNVDDDFDDNTELHVPKFD